MEVLAGAILGAIIGSLGSVVLQSWFQTKRSRQEQRQQLVARYLLQLQDACESLYYRLDNVRKHGGESWMLDVTGSDEYYQTSTLYALGRVLALKRILLLDGVYAKIEDADFRNRLRNHLDEFEKQIHSPSFFKYHRLGLAELLIEQGSDHFRPATYFEFKKRYDSDPSTIAATVPAGEFISRLGSERIDGLQDELKTLVQNLTGETCLPSEIEPN